ncbi:hypothetical protein Tco_0339706 [Tanacetum coccineum]
MDEQSHYKQDKTITRQSINVKRHIFDVIGGTEEFEERDLNIEGDSWFQEKYSGRTHGGIGCSSSQANCPLTEKELHQLRMDEEALKEMLEEEAMNKKAQEEKIRLEQAENNAFFLEFGIVRYDSGYESSD